MFFVMYTLYSCIIAALFSCMFLVIGRNLLDQVNMESGNSYWDMAASFCVGMAAWLAVLRTLALILHSYRLSFYMTLAVFLLIVVLCIRRHGVVCAQGKACILAPVMWMVFTLYLLVKRLYDVNGTELNTLQSIGTLHSCRYVNLALWFTENDKIPVLNQSYGQAMLGSMSRMLGAENTNFTLVLWLAASVSCLHFFVYGMLRQHYGRWLSTALTSVVTMGSVSLSIYPVLVVDSGYPLLHNGYTDSVAGSVSLVIYLAYLIHILEDTPELRVCDYLFSFVLMVFWAMSAPQNIIITGCIGICLIGYLAAKKDYDRVKSAIKIAGVILGGGILGVLEGGMLTPGFLVEQIDLSGVMQFSSGSDASLGISIVPVMPYYIAELKSFSWDMPYIGDILQDVIDECRSGNFGLALYHVSLLLWDSVRIIFWALLGIVLTVRAACVKKKVDYWTVSGVIMFLVGYVITFGFALNNYKWELSRFMMPVYFVGMIFLAFWIGRAWNERRYRAFALIAIGLILAGEVPYKISSIMATCRQNDVLMLLKEMIMFTDRFI